MLFHDALANAPFTKILAASDGHSVPETHWFGAIFPGAGLGSALEQMIDTQVLSSKPEAEQIAARIFVKSAGTL